MFQRDATLLWTSPNFPIYGPRVVSTAPFAPDVAVQLSGNTFLTSRGETWLFEETAFRSGIIAWRRMLDAPPLAAGSMAAWIDYFWVKAGHVGVLIVADNGDLWWWTDQEGIPFYWRLIGNVFDTPTPVPASSWGDLKARYRR